MVIRGKEKGQAIVLVALTMLVMCLFAFMTINTGIVFYRRIQMQNAADCAALSSTRMLARSLNTVANTNNIIGILDACYFGFLPPIFWGRSTMPKMMKGFYEAMRTIETTWVRAAALHSWHMGTKVAKLNGADVAVPTGGFSLKLRGRRIRVWFYRCIEIPTPSGTIVIPIPVGRKTYNPAYYRRKWETSKKKAQPSHKLTWVVSKKAYKPFGKALFGGSMSSKRTYASARAKVFYDCKRSYWAHYGGFPRASSASWMEKAFIPQPLSPMNPAQFNAYLVPVPGYLGGLH